MLSILIPTYNYDITLLVSELHKQATNSGIIFEIIALDDKSHNNIILKNRSINKLEFTQYICSEQNNGIAITRQLLAQKAKYNWILLLDADVKLKSEFYILNYLNVIPLKYDVFFGGISYEIKTPNTDKLLRWKYGVNCEAINAKKRNRTPYKITSAANMLIKKDFYKSFELDSIGNSYGMDIFFGPQLKLNNIPVLHINNEIYHLGLESSKTYLKKTRYAVETILNLYVKNKIKLHENDLLRVFILSKKTRLNYVFSVCFKIFEKTMTKNLLGKYPSIKLFQFYKIAYMCYFNLAKKTNQTD